MLNTTTGLIILALIGGMAVTIQGQFMGQMDKSIGTFESVFITYGVGAVCAGLVMVLLKGGNLTTAFTAVPLYTLTAGILGLIIVGSIGYTVLRLGVTATFTVFLVGQFFLAMVFDHFGTLGTEIRTVGAKQLTGIAVLLFGTYLITG